MQTPEVSIVTVGMNHLPLLKKFLKSLFVISRPRISFELVYVDNCSTDGSIDYINKNFPGVKIIKNKEIKGFSENNNIGVQNSSGRYIAIINPDIILNSGCIDNLYSYLRENGDIGILVPKLLNADMSTQYSVRRFMSKRTLFIRFLYGGRDTVNSKFINNYLLKDFDTEKIQPVDWALGAAMFLSRDTFNQLNGFDEDYFLYVEDVDLCLRSWKSGRPVIYYPLSVMIHAHQRSSNKRFINKSKVMHIKSMLTFFTKHKMWYKRYSFMGK